MSANFYLSGQFQSMAETQCQRLNVRDSLSETQCQKLINRDSMSETHCQRLNVRDSMSETNCQRLNVRDSMAKIERQRCIVRGVFSYPFLDCCKDFSECELAPDYIYTLGHLVQHRCTDFYSSVHHTGRPCVRDSWRYYDDGCLVHLTFTGWIWESPRGYDTLQVTIYNLTELVQIICIICHLVLDTLWPKLEEITTQINNVRVNWICKST